MENFDNKIIIALHRSVNELDRKSSALVREYGLTLGQFAVLEVLFSKGQLCIGEIKEKILSSTGTIPVIISNLEKRNLIERSSNKDDKRFSLIILSKKGKELIEDIIPRNEQLIKESLSFLEEKDKKDLLALLKKITYKE